MNQAQKNENELEFLAIGRRIRSARMLAGLSRKELSEKSKISAPTLRSWENPIGNRKGLTKKGAPRLIEALHEAGVICSIKWLMTGKGPAPTLLKQNVYDAKSEDVVTWDEEESIFKEIEHFKEVNTSPIVVQVIDAGMEPYFEQGSYVGGNKVPTEMITNLIGLNCIVETVDGDFFIRKLQKGSEGRFTLMCLNTAKNIKDLLMSDIALISAAEVVWYRKRRSTGLNNNAKR